MWLRYVFQLSTQKTTVKSS